MVSSGTSHKALDVGDRVRLLRMEDPSGLVPGDEGTIVLIGEVCAADIESSPELMNLVGMKRYWVEWDRGGTMAMIDGVDRFEVL